MIGLWRYQKSIHWE